ncbi:GrlR family regulatory protein [Pseudomonas gingeri]|uniref:GrlR family regulatory protein n=1 Tax=Pseudomonas gingeri TaxID=117681 RepID=UPI0015A0B2AB|nr:GrlR family regulatory protein [Pseudomonas gingeri]NWE45311.1 hypothetical protein [Pseudomonas gingeri]
MSQGIFHIKFKANTQDFGEGLIVIKNGSVNGGDPNFLYRGSVPDTSGAFTSEFHISQWKPGNTDVFGSTGSYVLNARGEIDYERGTFSLEGSPRDKPNFSLRAVGQKVADTM